MCRNDHSSFSTHNIVVHFYFKPARMEWVKSTKFSRKNQKKTKKASDEENIIQVTESK